MTLCKKKAFFIYLFHEPLLSFLMKTSYFLIKPNSSSMVVFLFFLIYLLDVFFLLFIHKVMTVYFFRGSKIVKRFGLGVIH